MVVNEEITARSNPTSSGASTKQDGTEPGRFTKRDSKVRIGLVERHRAYRTASPLILALKKPSFQKG